MAVRFYLLPKIGTGASQNNPFRPKYVSTMGVKWEAMDYGQEPTMLVAADVSAAQHTTITANADVTAVPQNLDSAVGANEAAVQSALEAVNLPGSWVNANHTYRQVLYGIATVMTLAQRLYSRHLARFFDSGITLNTTIGDLTQAQRDRLRDVADSFSIDYSGVTLQTTLRQALRLLAQQMPTRAMLGEGFQRA